MVNGVYKLQVKVNSVLTVLAMLLKNKDTVSHPKFNNEDIAGRFSHCQVGQ